MFCRDGCLLMHTNTCTPYTHANGASAQPHSLNSDLSWCERECVCRRFHNTQLYVVHKRNIRNIFDIRTQPNIYLNMYWSIPLWDLLSIRMRFALSLYLPFHVPWIRFDFIFYTETHSHRLYDALRSSMYACILLSLLTPYQIVDERTADNFCSVSNSICVYDFSVMSYCVMCCSFHRSTILTTQIEARFCYCCCIFCVLFIESFWTINSEFYTQKMW